MLFYVLSGNCELHKKVEFSGVVQVLLLLQKKSRLLGKFQTLYELILTYSRGLLEIEWLQEEEKAWKIGGDQVRILMSSYPLESQAQSLAQRLTNGGPWARSGQSPAFINKALLKYGSGHNTFKCYLQLLLQYTVAELCSCTRLYGPQSLKYLLSAPLQQKFAYSDLQAVPHFIMAVF